MNWKDRIRYWWRKRRIRAKYPKCVILITEYEEYLCTTKSSVRVEALNVRASYSKPTKIDVSFIRYMYGDDDWELDIGIKHEEDFRKVMDIWNILVPDTDAIPEYGLGILIAM